MCKCDIHHGLTKYLEATQLKMTAGSSGTAQTWSEGRYKSTLGSIKDQTNISDTDYRDKGDHHVSKTLVRSLMDCQEKLLHSHDVLAFLHWTLTSHRWLSTYNIIGGFETVVQ